MSALQPLDPGYRRAFLDWMSCAWAGRNEPASVAVRSAGVDHVVALAVAGHILDFDDTYAPGLSHLSAPTAPTALVLGARLGTPIGLVLEAYASGFEAMAALAGASHPALYERGWHPTAVTGGVGAAVVAGNLMGLDGERLGHARRLAALGAGGMQAAFGTDGKSVQVGMAAAGGVRAARLAASGVTTSDDVERAFGALYGGHWAEPDEEPAIGENWIKPYPCCLQTHSSIEAAERARERGADIHGSGVLTVHRRSRQAAPLDDVATGLEAKFSIPYTAAFTLLHGSPGVADFEGVEAAARDLASRIEIRTDDDLAESAAVLIWSGNHEPIEIRVDAARGSPLHPLSEEELTAKSHALAGDRFDGVLDSDLPAVEVLALVEDS